MQVVKIESKHWPMMRTWHVCITCDNRQKFHGYDTSLLYATRRALRLLREAGGQVWPTEKK